MLSLSISNLPDFLSIKRNTPVNALIRIKKKIMRNTIKNRKSAITTAGLIILTTYYITFHLNVNKKF